MVGGVLQCSDAKSSGAIVQTDGAGIRFVLLQPVLYIVGNWSLVKVVNIVFCHWWFGNVHTVVMWAIHTTSFHPCVTARIITRYNYWSVRIIGSDNNNSSSGYANHYQLAVHAHRPYTSGAVKGDGSYNKPHRTQPQHSNTRDRWYVCTSPLQ